MLNLDYAKSINQVIREQNKRLDDRREFIMSASRICPKTDYFQRFYRLQFNQTINIDSDDVKFAQKLTEKNVYCLKCNSVLKIKLRKQTILESCTQCGGTRKFHKLP